MPTAEADRRALAGDAEEIMRERCAQACEAIDQDFSARLKAACRTNPTVIAVVAAVAVTGAGLARTIRALPLSAPATGQATRSDGGEP